MFFYFLLYTHSLSLSLFCLCLYLFIPSLYNVRSFIQLSELQSITIIYFFFFFMDHSVISMFYRFEECDNQPFEIELCKQSYAFPDITYINTYVLYNIHILILASTIVHFILSFFSFFFLICFALLCFAFRFSFFHNIFQGDYEIVLRPLFFVCLGKR